MSIVTVSATATALQQQLEADLATWPVVHAAAIVVTADGAVAAAGDVDRVLPWASVTKVVAALAVLRVVREGRLSLDEPAGALGSTVRHLLGHASGMAFDDERLLAAPGKRRIYSNTGIDLVAGLAAHRAGLPDAPTLLQDRVLEPLGMTRTVMTGPAAFGAEGPVRDLARLAQELLEPRVLSPWVVATALLPSFPGLAGVLPGFGRQVPNDWGLGIERRGRKSPHWMPASFPPDSAGHFGQAGAFVAVEPETRIGFASATGTPFGDWAATAWPRDLARWRATWRGEGDQTEGAER